jgi:hypothetical protein
MIEIEKGVPLPAHRDPPVRRYPFREMEVGDSFTVEGDSTALSRLAGYGNGRFHPKRFVQRKIAPNTYRVWRVE